MYFLGLGLVLLGLKWADVGPVALWDWWVIFSPFGLAVLWWAWADASGYTKKKIMQAEQARIQARIERNREAIGTSKNQTKNKQR